MTTIDKELIDPSSEPIEETAHFFARAALAAIPFGGTCVEIFNAIIEPPMARRKTAWMIQVTDALNQLFEKGILTEQDLQTNERFFTTLVHASSVAIRNHEQAKLEALRNAVLNSALPDAPDDTLQQIFLNVIDSCTSWHIALLKLFQDPVRWAREHNHQFPNWSAGGLDSVIENAFPALRGQKELYRIVWQELFRNGLINSDSLGTTMTAAGMLSMRTTPIGNKFLAFISEPVLMAP